MTPWSGHCGVHYLNVSILHMSVSSFTIQFLCQISASSPPHRGPDALPCSPGAPLLCPAVMQSGGEPSLLTLFQCIVVSVGPLRKALHLKV